MGFDRFRRLGTLASPLCHQLGAPFCSRDHTAFARPRRGEPHGYRRTRSRSRPPAHDSCNPRSKETRYPRLDARNASTDGGKSPSHQQGRRRNRPGSSSRPRLMIITQVVPGQEEGNARLIIDKEAGAVATTPLEISATTRRAFAHGAQEWLRWQRGRLPRSTKCNR